MIRRIRSKRETKLKDPKKQTSAFNSKLDEDTGWDEENGLLPRSVGECAIKVDGQACWPRD